MMKQNAKKLTGFILTLALLVFLIPNTGIIADAKEPGKTAEISEMNMAASPNSIFIAGVAGQEYICVPAGTAVTEDHWKESTLPDPESDNGLQFDDLTPATVYDIYTRTHETETAAAGEPVKLTVNTLIDSVGLLFDSFLVGEEVTVEPDPDNEAYTFQWYLADVTEDAEGALHYKYEEVPGATGRTFNLLPEYEGRHFSIRIYKDGREVGDCDSGDVVAYGTVKFNSCGGSEVAPVTGLTAGEKVTKPADPTREGYDFAGWYWEDTYETEWNFDQDAPLWSETELFAKWTEKATQTEENGVPMFRLFYPGTHEHLYTSDSHEVYVLSSQERGWIYEGIAWYAPTSGKPVHRLFNPYTTDHHYTLDDNERKVLVSQGWIYEGISWYSDENEGKPVYRLFTPDLTTGTHHYTLDTHEKKVLIASGSWKDEGIAWYGLK